MEKRLLSMKHLIKKGIRRAMSFAHSLRYRKIGQSAGYLPGSTEWLIAVEQEFGGIIRHVSRKVVSPHDPRSDAELHRGGMIGGDRMLHHSYGAIYSQFFAPFLVSRFDKLTILEIGILNGIGLALWSTLFPNSDIIGLDIDLSHFSDNIANLKSKGAFPVQDAEVYVFDQFADGTDKIGEIVGCRRIDIVIDDGVHYIDAIVNTARAVKPFLKDHFVYFVEDNDRVSEALKYEFPSCEVKQFGELTVCSSTAA